MKRILFILAILLTSVCFAEEIATQKVDVDMSGIAVVINKQPENNSIQQITTIKRSGLIFIINVNGKVEIPQKTKE